MLPPPATIPSQRPKLMPAAVAMRTYREHQAFYDKLQHDVADAAGKAVGRSRHALGQRRGERAPHGASSSKFKPAVILISGCQDNQTSMDGEHNGALHRAAAEGLEPGRASRATTAASTRASRRAMPATQSPNLFALGSGRQRSWRKRRSASDAAAPRAAAGASQDAMAQRLSSDITFVVPGQPRRLPAGALGDRAARVKAVGAGSARSAAAASRCA